MADDAHEAIQTITQQAELLFAAEPFEPQQFAELIAKLDPVILLLTEKAKAETEAREQLTQLNLWFEQIHKRILTERTVLVSSLKELNTGRKASHNYSMNR